MPKLSPQEWRALLQLDARERRQGLPQGFMTQVLAAESNGDSGAESDAGAQGLFQFMPGTAQRFGIDPFDPMQAADGAERYLGMLYKRYDGDARKALAGYNWGEGNVDKRGLTSLPRETFAYITKILSSLGPRSAQAATGAPEAPAMSYVDSPAFAAWLKQGPGAQDAPETPPLAQATPPPALSPQATPGGEQEVLPSETPGVQRIRVDIPYDEAPAVPLTPQGQVSNADAARLNDAQIAKAYGYDPDLIMRSSSYTPGMLAEWGQGLGEESGTLGNLGRRLGYGVLGAVASGAQIMQTGLGAVGLSDDATVALADLKVKILENARRKVAERSPTGLGFAAEMVGNLLVPTPPVATGSRLANAAIRGGIGALVGTPALNVSPNPEERLGSYAQEKGVQTAIGAGAGAAIDTAARGLGSLARTALAQSRGQKALDAAATENAAREAAYTRGVDTALDDNLAALEKHLDALDVHEKKVGRFEAREGQRRAAWERAVERSHRKAASRDAEALAEYDRAVQAEAARVAEKNAEALAGHAEQGVAVRKENRAALADYDARILNQRAAVSGAREVPGRYGPETIPSVKQALEMDVPTPPRAAPEPPVSRQPADVPLPDPNKTAGGRWRTNLRDIEPQELELQDFLRQPRGGSPGGVSLRDEELFTEVHDLLGRREGGASAASLLNDKGRSLQAMAEEAQQHGFIREADTGELLDALRESMGGRQVYSRFRTPPDLEQVPTALPSLVERTARSQREPGAGSVVDQLYDKTRAVGGGAMVHMGAAQEAAGAVQAQLASVAGAAGSPAHRLATAIGGLGEEATVADLLPLLREAGKLTRSSDSGTRSMARELFAGLHDVLDQSASQLPETAQARTLLQAATKAARRAYAVSDLEDMVTAAIGRNSTGQFHTLNIAQLLRTVERKFASNKRADRLFTESFTPQERASILGDFERFAGLRPIPNQPPTLKQLPEAPELLQPRAITPPTATPVDVPAWQGRRPRPLGLAEAPPAPTLKTLPEVPELVTPQLPPLHISSLVRDATIGGGGLGTLGALTGGNILQAAALGSTLAVAGDVAAQLFAKAFLNPRLRPLILKAVNADGVVDPRLWGYLANQFTQERPSLPQQEP